MVDGPAIANLRSESQRLRNLGLSRGLSVDQINRCIREVLQNNNNNNGSVRAGVSPIPAVQEWRFRKIASRIVSGIALLLVTSCTLIMCHQPSQTIFFRHTQQFIYPTMRYLRLSTLPLHSVAPQITAWHEDLCLVYNSLYYNPDLQCWPCEKVRMIVVVPEIPGNAKSYCRSGVPFVVNEPSSSNFTMPMFELFYRDNEEALTKGTLTFASSSSRISSANDLLRKKSDLVNKLDDVHITWNFQRVWAARALRTLFPRPYFVPNETEVSLQRFIFMDGPETKPYVLPKSEFANVWLSQKLGERVVTLMPSVECDGKCVPISTVLTPGDMLYYNWQYYKARFLSARGDFSITYMGSYY